MELAYASAGDPDLISSAHVRVCILFFMFLFSFSSCFSSPPCAEVYRLFPCVDSFPLFIFIFLLFFSFAFPVIQMAEGSSLDVNIGPMIHTWAKQPPSLRHTSCIVHRRAHECVPRINKRPSIRSVVWHPRGTPHEPLWRCPRVPGS